MSGRHVHPNDAGAGFDLNALLPILMMSTRSSAGGAAGAGNTNDSTLWIQMLIAILLPFLIRIIQPRLQTAVQNFKLRPNKAHRTIVHSKEVGVWRWWDDSDDEEAFNAVIQKAILTYINKVRASSVL